MVDHHPFISVLPLQSCFYMRSPCFKLSPQSTFYLLIYILGFWNPWTHVALAWIEEVAESTSTICSKHDYLVISAFCRSHVSYKSDKFWTVSDGRKLRRISTIVDSMVQGLQGTIAFTPILMIRRNIIRQSKESMRLLASHLGFFCGYRFVQKFYSF